jgi:FkbM family methyltransferase
MPRSLATVGWRLARQAYERAVRAPLGDRARRAIVGWLERRQLIGRARLPDGTTLLVDLASTVGRSIWIRGTYDAPLVSFLLQDLRPGEAFIDVGANVGYYAAMAVPRVGPEGLVVCIEPAPLPLSLLARSAHENGWKNVIVCSIAASERAAALPFAPARDSGTSRIAANGSVHVASLPLGEAILAWVGGRPVGALKVDVEGHEREALAGLAALFDGRAAPRRVLIEVLPEMDLGWRRSVFDFFLRRGYRAVEPGSGRAVSAEDVSDRLWNVGFEKRES